MESSDISLQLKALQQAIQNINSGSNGYAAQNQNQARQITSPLGKPVYGTEGTAPYIPFAPGTPTLAARQFTEQQDQNSIANRLNQAKYNLSVANASGGGGGGGAPKLTQTQIKNDLLGSMTTFVKERATAGTPYNDAVNEIWDNMDETDKQTLSLSDVQSQVKRIYELNGVDIDAVAGGGGEALYIPGFGPSGEVPKMPDQGEALKASDQVAPNYNLPFIPFDPNLKGNFASPFDQVKVGKTPGLANFPWYVR